MTFKGYREHSKINYGNTNGEAAATLEQVNVGSLQRIADATEKMAQNYVELQNSRDRYKRWYEEEAEKRRADARRIIALRGVITRPKRKSANA